MELGVFLYNRRNTEGKDGANVADYVGIDLGGTNIVAGVVDDRYRILAQAAVKTRAPRPAAEICADMAAVYRQAVAAAGLSEGEIGWIGVGSPGVIDPAAGRVELAANLGFQGAPVRALLEGETGKTVYLDNDANAAAYGEFLAGVGQGAGSLVMVTIGTGIGGGVILGGKIWSGFRYGGAELGHMVIRAGGRPCTCGRCGCLEAYVSATGLVKTTREAMKRAPDSLLWEVSGGLDQVSGRTAFRAADRGDPAAQAVLESYIADFVCGVANVINLLQPEVIAIGGGISREGERLVGPIREGALRVVMSRHSPQNTKILPASLGNDAGIIGAAFLGRDQA